MKKRLILTVIFILAVMLAASCTDSDDGGAPGEADENGGDVQVNNIEPGGVINIDLTGGDSVFIGFEPEMAPVNIMEQGEILSFNFIGVSLDTVLESRGVSEFAKIELAISGTDNKMDITAMAEAEAGVFLAWSESGEPETPFRVFPKDAGTANLLISDVVGIIITK